MSRPILDLVSLADLARSLGIERQRLLRQMETINLQCHGLALVQSPGTAKRRGRIYVNRTVLLALGVDMHGLTARVADLEGYAKSIDARVSDVEAKCA